MGRLSDLAAKISGTGQTGSVKSWALAQAAETEDQAGALSVLEAKVAALAAAPTPEPTPLPVVTSEAVQPGQSLQKAIDATPDGGLVQVAPGRYGPIDTTAKNALRILGLGGTGYNEGGRWGVVIVTDSSRPGIQDLGGGGGVVKHAGPTIECVNVYAPPVADSVTPSALVKVRDCNHFTLRDASLQGGFKAAVDVDASNVDRGGDCAYGVLERVNWVATLPNVTGFLMGNGYWLLDKVNGDLTGNAPTGAFVGEGVLNMNQCKFNHAGRHVYSTGAMGKIVGCDFEIAPLTDAYALTFESDGRHGSGSQHVITGCNLTPHADPLRAPRLVYFGPGTFGNSYSKLYNSQVNDTPASFVDLGSNSFQ